MEEKMADIRDEHGNPIELTDELGNPVVLTDEHGNPMRLTGVATKIGPTLGSLLCSGRDDGPSGGHGDGEQELLPHEGHDDGGRVRSTTSGSSSFDEEEEQSKMRKKEKKKDECYFSQFDEGDEKKRKKKSEKKKGFTQKIKEKLTGRRHKEEQPHTPHPQTTTATETAAPTSMDRPTEHLKRGAVEKINDGSGHHTH